MLTDSNLRSAVDALSAKLWSGGVSNPFATIEQLRHYVTEIAKRQSYPPFGFMTAARVYNTGALYGRGKGHRHFRQ